ncbi:hypothetical protein Pfo_031250 [Paulownia fortunei]|nr:hypothetical protein Pfo_031250 [Paulownia fortunei]
MALILAAFFGGITFLSYWYGIHPNAHSTVLSQIAMTTFGGQNIGFYIVQLATAMILAVAANTGFSAFPMLALNLARDKYLPHLYMDKAVLVITLFATRIEHVWPYLLIMPVVMFTFLKIKHHYLSIGKQLRLQYANNDNAVRHHYDGATVIVLVSNITKVTTEAIDYAQSIGDYVVAMHVSFDVNPKKELETSTQFKLDFPDVRYVDIHSSYRSIVKPALSFVDAVAKQAKKRGWQATYSYDGNQAVALFAEDPFAFDLITLDLNLPGLGGMQVASKIREMNDNMPLIMLTARDSESDQVLGLEMGADDYVTKPFSPITLIARIKAIARRAEKAAINTQPAHEKFDVTTEHFQLNSNTREVFLDVDTDDDSGSKLNVDPNVFKTAKKSCPTKYWTKKISETLWQETFSGDSRIKRTQSGERLSVYRGWMYGGEKLGVVRVSRQIVGRSAQSTMLLEEMVAAMVIGGTLAMSLAAVISWRWSHVITDMQQATEQMAEGNYELKLKRTGKDELGHLASDINNLSLALRAQSDEIIEQEERRKQFMANASHEMRTPLTTMSGLLEGLSYDVFPEEEKSQENLDYEKLRANKIVLRKQKIDAYKMISDLSNQLSNKAAQEETTIDVLGDQQAMVFGDQDRLTQVLFNLINNAIQFTQKGQIKVSVGRQGNATIFTVSDTGIGMTAEQVDNVFERYYKADPSRMSTKGESGIGMAIVKQIVTLHDGDITIDSTPNVGTTITVTIQINKLLINFSQERVYKILTEI